MIPELRFDGRAIVVTGAGTGMGRTHALLLAARGAKVVLNGSTPEPIEAVLREIRDAGGEAVAHVTSVASEEGCAAIVQVALDSFGRIDGVVHNAGVSGNRPVTDITLDSYRRIMAVNLDAAVFLARAAWPQMMKQRYGRFVLISSTAGLEGQMGSEEYATAKMGQVGLAHCLALDGADYGIKTNVLAVAAFTRLQQAWAATRLGPYGPAVQEWFGEYMRSDLVSPAVVWLMHEDCPVSGEVFLAAGGRMARLIVAETSGFTKLDLTPEDVRDHFDQICEETGYHVFKSVPASLTFTQEQMMAAGAKPAPKLPSRM